MLAGYLAVETNEETYVGAAGQRDHCGSHARHQACAVQLCVSHLVGGGRVLAEAEAEAVSGVGWNQGSSLSRIEASRRALDSGVKRTAWSGGLVGYEGQLRGDYCIVSVRVEC